MKINTKFGCGDTVYLIHRQSATVWIPCSGCDASGWITLNDGEEKICPKCYGDKGKTEYGSEVWQYVRAMTVGQVRIEITDSPGLMGEECFHNYMPQSSREEKYMCTETGIGTGSLWNGNDLFATREEAVAERESRNAAIAKEK